MFLHDDQKYFILVKDGQAVTGALIESEAILIKNTKYTLTEQQQIVLVPATRDGRRLLNG